jgi:hypothetical protein
LKKERNINQKNVISIEWKIITNTKRKMIANQLIIAKANKRNTTTILTQDKCKQNINTFIKENNFATINNNLTQHYQKEIKQTLKQCKNRIQKE